MAAPQGSFDRLFARMDESPDAFFYSLPRKVVHIDEGAIAAVGALYQELLPAGGAFLDLMSSWRSHLPAGFNPRLVVGLGLNGEEMADNHQLDVAVVHDVNRNPNIPFQDDVFDGVMCAVSVQYLVKPVAVFQQVNRVLKPEAPFIVTFSNRCFPNKAIAAWLYSGDQEHVQLVHGYFQSSGGWSRVSDHATRGTGDPLFAVWGFKQAFV